ISLKDVIDLLRMVCKEKYKDTSRSESFYSSDSSYQEILPRKFTLIRNYLKQNNIIESRYFYQRYNDHYFNQEYTKFD
ncbi:12732_t:CDS:1, partial [Cetraspora pellucida]